MNVNRGSRKAGGAGSGLNGATAPAAQLSRRTALAGGLGITALVAVPEILLGSTAYAAQAAGGAAAATTGAAAAATGPGASAASSARHFFLYGTTGANAPSGVQGWQAPAGLGALDTAPTVVTTNLEAAPVRSPDGSTVALVSKTSAGSASALTLTLVGTGFGAATSSSVLNLPGVSAQASVLATPVFAGTGTVALVLAVSERSDPRAVAKTSPFGGTVTTTGYTWTTSHSVAYLDRAAGTFTGPFPLFDAPYLALTDLAADSGHLYLWAVRDYTKMALGKGRANPEVTTEFFAVPLGSGTPDLTRVSAGPWPSGAGAQVLANGDVARVVAGRSLEVFAPARGALSLTRIAPMTQVRAAKPGATTFESLPNGTALITNSAFGRATVVDPAAAYSTVSVIDYARVPHPVRGATASADGTTLYTLGKVGLDAYDIATGSLSACYADSESYAGVFQLGSGTLLAVKPTTAPSPQTKLSFFTPSLEPVGSASTSVLVAAVY
jgi:hypothetical protein